MLGFFTKTSILAILLSIFVITYAGNKPTTEAPAPPPAEEEVEAADVSVPMKCDPREYVQRGY